ncbi:MAG TPA: SAM-dependent methyltransferase, partial [Spongiibacteraceae bacterium]|nr:SAM-dependent methyltransferase [Spongiibacteraceae bacterium]
QGTVFKNAQDKFRQISRYIELLDPLLDALPPGPLSIVDMGSGKGYLTFALYDHLRHTRQREVRITGIEYREDLVNLCNRIAAQCDYTQLAFLRGSIADYPQADADVVIALHACDTATGDAIAQGIRAGAQLIVVAPYCHKQIRRAMQAGNSPHPLSFVTRHGIFMERQAEMITDALRALILERHGYKTRAFEFVSDAHTAKNVLVVAQRRATPPDTGQLRALQQQIDDAKKLFGIGQHYLETLV